MTRWQYFLQRVVLALPVVIIGTTVTFLIVFVGPIDPCGAVAGQKSQIYEQCVRKNNLNAPLWEQYIDYMTKLFTFDLGRSWVVHDALDAKQVIAIYAPRTIWLGFWSVVIAIFIGVPLGFYAGLNPNTMGDYTASFGGIVWRAMPNFWLAIILVNGLSAGGYLENFTKGFPHIELFGWTILDPPFNWRTWLVDTPSVVTPPELHFFEMDWIYVADLVLFDLQIPELWGITIFWGAVAVATKKIMPAAIVLGSASMGNEMRIGRTAVLETINSNYVETARAKGLSNRVIVWKHVFRNALIPLVPVITGEMFLLLGGSVLVETVFAINGLGWLFFRAAVQGDIPLVATLMYIFILLLVFTNILQDFLYTVIDPRVGYERS